MGPDQRMRKPRHAAVMAGTLAAAVSGAAQLFRKIGIKGPWKEDEMRGNAFDSEACKKVQRGKKRQDAKAGIKSEQAPEITSKDYANVQWALLEVSMLMEFKHTGERCTRLFVTIWHLVYR